MDSTISKGVTPLSFLDGGGACGALARAVDWSTTALGPPTEWPQSLKTTVAMLLHSRHPMFLWWGDDLIQIYNDAYLPSFGEGKHPKAMGQRGEDCWQEIWPIIWPQIDDVMRRGKSSWNEDQLVPIFRNGRIEDVYWTYGYSPIFNEAGAIAGTLVVCTETTSRLLAERRLRSINVLGEGMSVAQEPKELFEAVVTALNQFQNDIPFALIYTTTLHNGAQLLASVGLPDKARDRVDGYLRAHLASIVDADSGPSAQSIFNLDAALLSNLWPKPVTQVCIQPLADLTSGIVVAFGLSTRLSFDAPYHDYLNRLTERIAEALRRLEADKVRETLVGEVRAEKERLSNLFAQAPAFMCALEGPDHVFTLANDRYYQLIGRRDIIGKRVREALPEIAGQGFTVCLDQVYKTGESYFGSDVPVQLVRRVDQPPEERFIDFVYQASRAADGSIIGILVHGIDQTDRRRVAEAMKDAERHKDEFLGLLAHELRNPLAPIMNYVHILERLSNEPEAIKQASNVISRQVRQLVRLIDDLLDVSRISTGKIELRQTRIEMASVVNQAVEASRPLYDARHINLTVSLPEQPVYIDADSARLTQIIGNLLHNAAKFTNPGGHAWLTVERAGDQAILRVRDDGIGIGPRELSRIFAMFAQVDTSLERSRDGLGIGLGLVRRLVELHGGTVEAHSEGITQGSEFVVRLPTATNNPSRERMENVSNTTAPAGHSHTDRG